MGGRRLGIGIGLLILGVALVATALVYYQWALDSARANSCSPGGPCAPLIGLGGFPMLTVLFMLAGGFLSILGGTSMLWAEGTYPA